MKQQERMLLLPFGGSSLLAVFGVLCLTVLALLSLSTVLAERRAAEAAHQAVTAWYEADLEAQARFARLRSGEEVPGVVRTGAEYRFEVPISRNQTLQAALIHREGRWTILRWQAVAQPEETDQALPVWQGEP